MSFHENNVILHRRQSSCSVVGNMFSSFLRFSKSRSNRNTTPEIALNIRHTIHISADAKISVLFFVFFLREAGCALHSNDSLCRVVNAFTYLVNYVIMSTLLRQSEKYSKLLHYFRPVLMFTSCNLH